MLDKTKDQISIKNRVCEDLVTPSHHQKTDHWLLLFSLLSSQSCCERNFSPSQSSWALSNLLVSRFWAEHKARARAAIVSSPRQAILWFSLGEFLTGDFTIIRTGTQRRCRGCSDSLKVLSLCGAHSLDMRSHSFPSLTLSVVVRKKF